MKLTNIHKQFRMKKTFLLVTLLFLFAGVKAQHVKTKNTEVTGHREGHSPEMKEQQQQVQNGTQAFPKPVDSVKASAKTRSAGGSQVILKPLDSLAVNRKITADKNAAGATQLIKGKVSTTKPEQTATQKPVGQPMLKQHE